MKNILFQQTITLAFLFISSASLLANNELVKFSEHYAFHPGDSSHWADPNYNDEHWNLNPLKEFPKDWVGIGWARINFKLDSTMLNEPLGIKFHFVGAVEIYLDGNLVVNYGTVGKSLESEHAKFIFEYPVVKPLPLIQSKGTIKNEYSKHLIAIRFSNFVVHEGILSGFPNDFKIEVDDLNKLLNEEFNTGQKVKAYQMFFMGILLAFGLIHFLLFVYYKNFKPNLYFALLSLIILLLAYTRFERILIDDIEPLIWNLRLFNFCTISALLLFLRFTYFLSYRKTPSTFLLLILIAAASLTWFWFQPIAAWNYTVIVLVLIVIEILRVILSSSIKKKALLFEGSWIILIGVLPFMIASLYTFSTMLNFLPKLWYFLEFPHTYFSLLILLFAMSVFLAKNFSSTNKNLALQLEQVKLLSEENLKKEVEKVKLESENERKDKELKAARELQLSMLPKEVPTITNLDIKVYMKTATEVGGDFYDFVRMNDDTLVIAFGDATGHGMQAGTMVAASKSLFRDKAEKTEPAEHLRESSNSLKQMGFHLMLMAMLIAKIKDRTITISNAGMSFPLLFKKNENKLVEIEKSGMPLGSMKNFPYQQTELHLETGDTVLFFSDGFPELQNSEKEMLGYEETKKLFSGISDKSPKEILEHLIESSIKWAGDYPLQDDITLMVIKVK